MVWNIANLCYPVWGWATFISLWIGLVGHPLIFWIIGRLRIRAFVVAQFIPTDQNTSHPPNYLKHLGFLFSVWENRDSLTLAYYHDYDKVVCSKRRFVSLTISEQYRKWVGWLIFLSTDAIPVAVLVGLLGACYFHGIGTIVFFVMGLILAFQLHTLYFRSRKACYYWKDEMFLDEKKCNTKPLGLMTCILEGPDGELFLTFPKVAWFDHYRKHVWIARAAIYICDCCSSVPDGVV
jgi:hypothetical protein